MIYKKYVFDHSVNQNIFLIHSRFLSMVPGLQLLKPLKFPIIKVMRASSVMLIRWLLEALRGPKDEGRVPTWTVWLQSWIFQSPSPSSQGGDRGWRLSSIAHSQIFNQSCLCNESFIKNPKGQSSEMAGEHIKVLRTQYTWRGQGNSRPFSTYFAICILKGSRFCHSKVCLWHKNFELKVIKTQHIQEKLFTSLSTA